MKVAVTSKGKTLDAKVEQRFSRSPFFVIVNTETGDFKALENPGASAKPKFPLKMPTKRFYLIEFPTEGGYYYFIYVPM